MSRLHDELAPQVKVLRETGNTHQINAARAEIDIHLVEEVATVLASLGQLAEFGKVSTKSAKALVLWTTGLVFATFLNVLVVLLR